MDGMQKLLSSLAQTPLSLAQRDMFAELQDLMDGLKNDHGGMIKIANYPVELPNLRGSEFDFGKVAESAFGTIRATAKAAGVAAQVSASGIIPGKVFGYAEHVHQLITLLSVSPFDMVTGITALNLRVAIKCRSAKVAEMTLRAAWSTENDAQELLALFASVTDAAATLQTGAFDEGDFGLAAGWQLALAMGARATLEVDGGRGVCLLLSLPMELVSQRWETDEFLAYVPPFNGNGNGNGNGHRHHNGSGNGHYMDESWSAIQA